MRIFINKQLLNWACHPGEKDFMPREMERTLGFWHDFSLRYRSEGRGCVSIRIFSTRSLCSVEFFSGLPIS